MTILDTAKIGKNFRITIPQEVRESLDLEEGNEIVFFTVEDYEGRICFRKK
ncbi:MAG: AbrB/MazE/SpoVT family DNA-binding domain-containing protein [Thermoproteota archaeon]